MRAPRIGLVIGALSLTGSATAADNNMWGVGGGLGTMAFPGAYPAIWPSRVNTFDVDGDGDPECCKPNGDDLETTLEKVRGDVRITGEGYYWLDRTGRVGGYANVDTGNGFTDASLVLKYDRRLVGKAQDSFGIYLGGGLGFGSATFKGLTEAGEVDPAENAERLVLNYFPARIEATPFINFNDKWALQPKIWGGLNIPSGHRWMVDGEEVEGIQGTLFNYVAIGIDVGFLYGDFSPPPPDKRKGGNKGKTGGKGKSGGGKHKG